jgi:hypothetical protein
MLAGTMQARGDLLVNAISKMPDEFEKTRIQLLNAIAG